VLDLIEDADLFQGRSAAGYYTLRAQSSWHVDIRFEGKSGYLERVDMIRSQEVLCWLLAAQLDCKKDGKDREINGFI